MHAVGGLHAHTGGRRLLEQPQPGLDPRQQLLHPVELGRGAGDRLQAGALREPADPRRAAAVEREVVLPREPAAARDRDRHQLVEQQGVARVVAARALGVRVELAEVGQRVELDALPGHVLPDQLGAREGDALAAVEQRLAIDHHSALRWSVRKSGNRRAGAQLAARGDRPRSAASAPASWALRAPDQRADAALDVAMDRAVGVVGGLVDRAGRVQLLQLARDRLALRGVGGLRADRADAPRRACTAAQCTAQSMCSSARPWSDARLALPACHPLQHSLRPSVSPSTGAPCR